MRTQIQRGTVVLGRLMDVPVLREIIGAASGCAVALALYGAFELARALVGFGSPDAVGGLHAAAGAVAAQGVAGLSIPCFLALSAGCAFVHKRLASAGSARPS